MSPAGKPYKACVDPIRDGWLWNVWFEGVPIAHGFSDWRWSAWIGVRTAIRRHKTQPKRPKTEIRWFA